MEDFGKHGSKGSLDWKKVEFVQAALAKKKEEREGFIEKIMEMSHKTNNTGWGKKLELQKE